MRTIRRVVSAGAAATVMVVGLATAASAHPTFRPNEVPPGEELDLTLLVPHGCNPEGGMPEEGNAEPTLELAVQVPDWIEIEPVEKDGWILDITETDGKVSEFAWVNEDEAATSTDPLEFEVTATVLDGDAGETRYLSVYQGCENGSFRWIGTPDDEAEFPAAYLNLTAGEVGQAVEGDDHDHMDVGDDEHDDMAMDDGGTGDTVDHDATDASGDDMAGEMTGDGMADAEVASATDQGGTNVVAIAAIAIAAFFVAAFAIWLGRRRESR